MFVLIIIDCVLLLDIETFEFARGVLLFASDDELVLLKLVKLLVFLLLVSVVVVDSFIVDELFAFIPVVVVALVAIVMSFKVLHSEASSISF